MQKLHWDGVQWVSTPPSPVIVQTPKKKTILFFKPNWFMFGLLLLAVPAAGFLITADQPVEEEVVTVPAVDVAPIESDEEIEVIVDSIFRSIERGTYMSESRAKQVKENGSRFKEWMWYLKAREGFIPHPYRCPAGYLTIGYGHNIDAHGWSKAKKYMKDGKLTYQGATQLLYDDVQEELVKVGNMAPHLNRNQKLAIASLFANCGSYKITGPKNRPTPFWKAVMRGKTPNFSVYCKYRKAGKVVVAANLVAARSFEQSLFEGCTKPVKIQTGKSLVHVPFVKAASHYRGCIVMRDIVPSKKRGNFD